MKNWMKFGTRRETRHLGLALLLAGSIAAPALAETAPSNTPARNIMAWPMPETVSAEGRAMTSAMANAPVPNPWPPVAAQRQFADSVQTSFGDQLRKRYAVTLESGEIGGVPVRIVYPKGMTSLGTGPVLVNLHGGGFSLDSGSLTETIPIAALTGIPVVAVLYRLAPEHPYPAAVDDALAVYQALEKERGPASVAVYGTSAGACLGAQLISRLDKVGAPLPAALGFFSGGTDFSKTTDSETWQPLPNGGKTLAASMADYIGKTPPTDPGISPIFGDLSRFPPTLLVSSTRDILLSGTSIFARALLEHGVDARLVVFDGLPHAFWSYMPIPETDQANALMARFLKSHLERRAH